MKVKSLIIAGILGTAMAAQGNLIVHWGESGGDTGIVGGNISGSTATTYTDGASINPTVGASYYPNATGRTPTYNGAHETSGNGHNVQDRSSPGDRMFINGNPGSGGVASMFAWENGVHTLSSTAGLTLGTFTWAGQLRSAADTGSIRFLVEDSGGAWHASESFAITDPATGLDTVSQAASALSWSTFNPFSAGAFSIGGGSSPSLESVQSVGFFADVSGTIANTGMAMEFFQVTAVPEPSSLALLGMGAAILMAARRRNNRK